MLSPSRVNAHGLPSNWLWCVGLVASRFYWPKARPNGSSLGRFPILSKKKCYLLKIYKSSGVYVSVLLHCIFLAGLVINSLNDIWSIDRKRI